MSPRDQIIMGAPQDTDVLSRVIALAFQSLAPSVWLIPDERIRREIFPGYFRIYVQDAMKRGHVYTTAERTAVALWLPAGEPAAPSPTDYDAALASATGPWVDRFRMFDALLDKHHPSMPIHDHLAILAVHPAHQHQGIGAALLDVHHRCLEGSDPPRAAYLEASDSATRELYRWHGYHDQADGPIQLPDGPVMWPMLREPQSRSEAS